MRDEEKIKEDRSEFEKKIMTSLYIFNCLDAMEFNLVVRSLASFLKLQKNIGLIIIDGLHFIENLDF
jgi:hypothetical protein